MRRLTRVLEAWRESRLLVQAAEGERVRGRARKGVRKGVRREGAQVGRCVYFFASPKSMQWIRLAFRPSPIR